MDAFEQLVARIFERDHFWILQNFKVDLEREDKVDIGLPTMPRPDIDIIAYDARDNVVLWIECKSFIDSGGVNYSSFVEGAPEAKRFRIFTDENYRRVVTERLLNQLVKDEWVPRKPKIEYWLVAGKIHKGSLESLKHHFTKNNWTLKGPDWIKKKLATQIASSYVNDAVIMAAKIMSR